MTTAASTVFPAFESGEGRARHLAAYDAVLRDWPVPFEEIDVATRLGPTHVIASGSAGAPALVLLPSFAATATVWRPNVAALSREFRTYAVDVIGQPGKSLAMEPVRDRRQYAQWLTDVFDGLAVDRASIVGCSFGGFLALNQASLRPERIARTVLISPVGVFSSQDWRLFYLMRFRPAWLKLTRRRSGNPRAPGVADLRALGSRLDPGDANWRTLMSVTMSEAPKASVIAAAVFGRTELRAIRAPTLLLIGDKERLYEPEAMLTMANRRMPRLEGAIVADADHIAAMAQPDDVNARILRFLGTGAGQ